MNRYMRGGSWCYSLDFARAVYRLDINPCARDYSVGFRVVRRREADGKLRSNN